MESRSLSILVKVWASIPGGAVEEDAMGDATACAFDL